MFEILGISGITISMLAYVPQVIHLGREHCSAGISRRALAMWLVASLLVGALAVHRGDLVFIALQFSTLASTAVILYLAQEVPWHGLRSAPSQPGAPAHSDWWTTASFQAPRTPKAFCFLALRHIQVVESSSARPISAPTSSNSSHLIGDCPASAGCANQIGEIESEPRRFGVVAGSA